VMRPILILFGVAFALFAVGISFFNHGKVPEWAAKVLLFFFS
jgi:hypothetical protein